ncbi:hypothetical protein Hanom_Chr00s131915g01815671 [Helianthus anomalus]
MTAFVDFNQSWLQSSFSGFQHLIIDGNLLHVVRFPIIYLDFLTNLCFFCILHRSSIQLYLLCSFKN